MNDKIIDFLSRRVNNQNRHDNISGIIDEDYRYNDVKINVGMTDINMTVEHYLKYAYIDMLIENRKAPSELRDIYDIYLSLMNEYNEEIIKKNNCMDYSHVKINELSKRIGRIDFYLNLYGILDFKVDYNMLIKNYMTTLCDRFPQVDESKKRLVKLKNECKEM